MNISFLTRNILIKQTIGNPHIKIKKIRIDSREVKPGDLFVCLSGTLSDGHEFIKEAVTNGAVAILLEKDIHQSYPNITIIKVSDSRKALAIMANRFYGQASKQLRLIGVTGTNGKTTTTHLIEKILNDYDKKAGLIGTLTMRVGNHTEKAVNTTPESIELHRFLNEMVDRNAQYGVMEVSSHALKMGRVRGCDFKTAIFTNLTHDHLDYHHSMDHYLEDKSLLFSQLGNTYEDDPKAAIFNSDDPSSEKIAGKTTAQVITYGINNPADVRAEEIHINSKGTFIRVNTFKGNISIQLKIYGIFNVYNVLAAIAACLLEDIPLTHIKKSLEAFEGLPGRFQQVNVGQSYSVIVDYAHNPDGLENVLKTARELTKGRVYCVFGCEGDKDKKKRPIMAQIATTYSDKAILTSDNPRSENPEKIIHEMAVGIDVSQLDRCFTITNRKEAIQKAISLAKANDCIVIAGKGHEMYQIVNDTLIPFNDIHVVTKIIEEDRKSKDSVYLKIN
jgi:UDP-N-acetylmuramoyl-L-alanyl-D-glutamate--2,6-diaminopimelate ligase